MNYGQIIDSFAPLFRGGLQMNLFLPTPTSQPIAALIFFQEGDVEI